MKLAEHRRAFELDPLNLTVNVGHAMDLDIAGQEEAALAQWDRVFELEPDHARARVQVAGVAYVVMGNRQEAHRVLARLTAESGRRYVSPVLSAYVHAALDERDQAFALLEEAFAARDPLLVHVQTGTVAGYRFFPDGRGAALRSDPRFADLIRRWARACCSPPPLPRTKARDFPAASQESTPRGSYIAPP